MASDEVYDKAEKKIIAARRSGTTVNLGNMRLTELPKSLGALILLQSLDLSNNHLTVLPDWLGTLTQLRHLNLSRLQLTELPEWLSALTQLQSLNLGNNQLTELPGWLGALTQLQSLNLGNNQLTELPESLGALTQLQSLDVAGNKLATLPDSLHTLTQLQVLDLTHNQLEVLPESLGALTQLQLLNLGRNKLTELPEWLSSLTQLQSLKLSDNQLRTLPESLGNLTQLNLLHIYRNQLTELPESIGNLTKLYELAIYQNHLTSLPNSFTALVNLHVLRMGVNPMAENIDGLQWSGLKKLRELQIDGVGLKVLPVWLKELKALEFLYLDGNELINLSETFSDLVRLRKLSLGGSWGSGNPLGSLPENIGKLGRLESLVAVGCSLTDLPSSLADLAYLREINFNDNPFNPELVAAYREGLSAVKRYLRSKAEDQVVLNEAKLILIGEGEVGKSCLLGALCGDEWEEGRPTTHGIEIKLVKVTAPDSDKVITLNGWDFGGQRVYRPTHQLFFSAPAVYLVVWKPREGPQQGFVKEWIRLVKHREPEAKILVVATHGGPHERQPDIDRQELWDLFGKDMVIDFFHVDSKPNEQGVRPGIDELKTAIARVAASLPEVGRAVPKRWQETRDALQEINEAYLPLERVMKICRQHQMDEEEARLFVIISHRLGYLIHYEHDPALRDIVVLKPDWLATAISFVLDDKQTRAMHGLVSMARLSQLWNDPEATEEFRYPIDLHPVFVRLMEHFDLSYRVAGVRDGESNTTSLIAQLVPDVRPELELNRVWQQEVADGDEHQVQICRIVDAQNGQSATAEGLFYQLIVRLHKFSLGRANYAGSIHWQRGLVLDDDYNGRALLENIGNDVRITVRAPYPQGFLSVLTHEVKWLVESFWQGLRCDVMVPCIEPCGRGAPGIGLYDVRSLIESKREGYPKFPCPTCNKWQNIDSLLLNAPAIRPMPLEHLLAQGFDQVLSRLDGVRGQLSQIERDELKRFRTLDQNDLRLLSQIEDAFTDLMHTLTDEAKDGPRLFSLVPVNRTAFNPKQWTSEKFRLTLWCEHSRLPLPALNGKNSKIGVYEIELTRTWFKKAAPFLKVLTGTLSLVLPVASSTVKLALDDVSYKAIEEQLDFGQKSIEAVMGGGEKVGGWLGKGEMSDLEQEAAGRGETSDFEYEKAFSAQGAVLRELHALLKEKDPGFGGLVRVQNKRQEFLWVHEQFASEY